MSAMYGVYATAWEVVQYLGDQDDQTYQIPDQRFLNFTIQMSRKFDTLTKRRFAPERITYTYDHPAVGYQVRLSSSSFRPGFDVYPNVLKLDHDLLSLITLTTNNGALPITSDNIILRTGNSLNYLPKDIIELNIDGDQTVFFYSGTPQEANAVDGIWGYHESYDEAWQTLDTIQDTGGINASVTTITVEDADAFDEMGLKPRFQEQQLLRLGTTDTSEMVYIINVNHSSDTLQVTRACNGSTAAIAAKDTVIQVFRPMAEIKHAMLILASHAYRRKDTVGREGGDTQVFTPTGVITIPQTIPREVADMIKAYKRPLRMEI